MLRTIAVTFLLSAAVANSVNGQSSKLTGTWEGIEHAEGRDKPAALVLVPRGPQGFSGVFYFNGDSFGALEDGSMTGDSLRFHEGSLQFFAKLRDLNQLSVRLVVRPGKLHDFVLTHTTSDTTTRPLAGGFGKPRPLPRRDAAPDKVYSAHAVPPGRVTVINRALQKGTLYLVGGGAGTPEIHTAFVNLAGGPNANIVVVPTAAVAIDDPAVVRDLGQRMRQLLGVKRVTILHTFSRKQADSPEFVESLRHATGVWFTGGAATWLLDSYLGTRTEIELLGVLSRGGVVGGSSAGALIWGSSMLLYQARPGAPPYEIEHPEDLLLGDRRSNGFGLLRNATIAPHFSEFGTIKSMNRELAAMPGMLGIGIDENTVLEVHGEIGKVFGRGTVTIIDGNKPALSPTILKNGASYDLKRRQKH